ncbi:MAG: RpoL/Rpb11 RNA polymerase subunit family protein, partial [Nanoarchaeota archaeon]
MIKILDKSTNELRIEIDDVTICEVLRNELWQDKSTVIAAYSRKHPTENPVLHVVTEGKIAKKAFLEAIE